MRILGIETSAHHSSLALQVDGRLERESTFPSRMSLGQTLAAHIQDVLGCAVVSDAGLDGIGVSLGPGSFTGLRVGVAAAKALAHALEIPLVGISTHEALAWPVAGLVDCPVCVLQHARQDQVYCSVYAPGYVDGRLRPLLGTCVLGIDALIASLSTHGPRTVALGDGLERHEERLRAELGERVWIPPGFFHAPRASVIAHLSCERLGQADPDAAMNLKPAYFLVSQAEMTHGVDLGQK